MNKKIYGIAMGAVALSFMASCSNDVNNEVVNPEGGNLPKVVLPQNPDLVISSNGTTLYGTKAAEGETRATTKYEDDAVEVNLAIQDIHYRHNSNDLKYDFQDLVSHLTMHIRSGVDVEVTLPVPAMYYCDQDDLYIYTDRNEAAEFLSYYQKATLKLQGEYQVLVQEPGKTDRYETKYLGNKEENTGVVVALNIEFAPAKDARVNGSDDGTITVWTSGVTEDVLAYCQWHYGDGLTFDAYNYYNRANAETTGAEAFETISIENLKNVLDGSTVLFGKGVNVENAYGTFEPYAPVEGEGVLKGTAKDAPDYYINAFTGETITVDDTESDTEGATKEINRDCVVKVNAPQDAWFYTFPVLGDNGYNRVYVNTSVFGTNGENIPEIADQPENEVSED